MKIVVTADIHYGVGNNQRIVAGFSKRIIKIKADVLLLVGDTFAFDQQLLVECLTFEDGDLGCFWQTAYLYQFGECSAREISPLLYL